jgi:hypothetical protein
MSRIPPEISSDGVDLRMRPRFTAAAPIPHSDVIQRLREGLEEGPFEGSLYESSAVIKVPSHDRHFWSPQLHLSFESEASGTRIFGLLSPHPTIWSFFVAIYLAAGFAGTMAVLFGLSQIAAGGSPQALWGGPTALAVAGLAYLTARAGRRLGSEDTRRLVRFVTESTDSRLTE